MRYGRVGIACMLFLLLFGFDSMVLAEEGFTQKDHKIIYENRKRLDRLQDVLRRMAESSPELKELLHQMHLL